MRLTVKEYFALPEWARYVLFCVGGWIWDVDTDSIRFMDRPEGTP